MYLAGNPGRAISRDELLSRVWGLDPRGVQTRTVDMAVARVRELLKDDPADPRIIAFYSDATNLVPNDTNNFRDAFVRLLRQ